MRAAINFALGITAIVAPQYALYLLWQAEGSSPLFWLAVAVDAIYLHAVVNDN